MKYITVTGMLLVIACAIVSGCGRQGSTPQSPSTDGDARLFKLAHRNGCIDCHTVNTTSIGPSWLAVAERYKESPRAETRALLIDSVMKGSKGKWLTWRGSDGMPPLGKRVSKADIEELVDFILSLNH